MFELTDGFLDGFPESSPGRRVFLLHHFLDRNRDWDGGGTRSRGTHLDRRNQGNIVLVVKV